MEKILRDEISAVKFIAEDAARAKTTKPRPQTPPPKAAEPQAGGAGAPNNTATTPGQGEPDPNNAGDQSPGPAHPTQQRSGAQATGPDNPTAKNSGAQAKGPSNPAPQNGTETTETRKTYAEQATSPNKPVFLNPRSQQQVKNMSDTTKNSQNSNSKNENSSDKKQSKLAGPKPNGTGSSNKVPLAGVKQKKTCDLYVQDIARHNGDKFIDIANRVREHCQINDIRVSYARVYPKKFCSDTVNCRISVPIEDADSALGIRIWPDGVCCRRWNKDPPRRTTNTERKSRSTSRNQGPRSILRSRSRSRVRYDDEYDNFNQNDRYYDGYDDRYYSYYDRY